MEVLHGKVSSNVQTNYEEDLAKSNTINNIPVKNQIMSLNSDNFRDTFEHFNDEQNDSNSYSYI